MIDNNTLVFSATWPEGVRRLANEYMDNPIQVCVGTLDLAAVHTVTQHVEILAEEDKRQRVKYTNWSTSIFVTTIDLNSFSISLKVWNREIKRSSSLAES